MMVVFPSPSPGNVTGTFLVQVIDAIRKAFVPVVSKNEAVSRILLQSPDGTVYEVTVSNTGTLTTAVNDGKTRDI